jgi:hypothetical protein
LLVEVLPPSVAELPGGPLEAMFLDGARFRRDELDLVAGYGVPAEKLHRQWRETLLAPWYALRLPLVGRVAPSALPAGRRFDESRTCDSHGWYRIWEEALSPEAVAEARARARRNYADILRELNPGGPAARALRDTLALAREHGIPTRLVLMPDADDFRAMYSAKALARFDHWARELSRESGCALLDARRWVPDAGFVDGHHLFPGGSATFTDRLTDEVIAPALTDKEGAP